MANYPLGQLGPIEAPDDDACSISIGGREYTAVNPNNDEWVDRHGRPGQHRGRG